MQEVKFLSLFGDCLDKNLHSVFEYANITDISADRSVGIRHNILDKLTHSVVIVGQFVGIALKFGNAVKTVKRIIVTSIHGKLNRRKKPVNALCAGRSLQLHYSFGVFF